VRHRRGAPFVAAAPGAAFVTAHFEARTLSPSARLVRRFSAFCLLFSTVGSAQSVPAARRQPAVSPFGAAKARALMRERLPCTGCHAFQGNGGRIGPDLSGVADRRPPGYVRRMIEDPQRTAPGSIMPKVPMAGPVRELIIAYLGGDTAASTLAGGARQLDASLQERPALPVATRDASALYVRYCAPCHGVGGRGDGPNAVHLLVRPAAHSDPAYMSHRSDDRLFDAIYSGGYPLGRSVAMPAYGETLTRPQVWSLVRYLRDLCKCSGPAWSVDGDRSRRARPP
jgi:cytochrome c oxidase cbb3-type subunit 3